MDQLVKKCALISHGQSLDVLEDEVAGSQIRDDSHKLPNERITRIIERAMSYQRKSLTRRTAEYDIDGFSRCQLGFLPNFSCGEADDRACNHAALWKVELVSRRVNRVYLCRGHNIESSLLEPKAEPAGSRKQIETFRTLAHSSK